MCAQAVRTELRATMTYIISKIVFEEDEDPFSVIKLQKPGLSHAHCISFSNWFFNSLPPATSCSDVYHLALDCKQQQLRTL